MRKNVKIYVKDHRSDEVIIITDMYWFEEEGFKNNDDNGYTGDYEIIGMEFD